jgi:plasmid maintenance system antidote protein VapI
MDGHTIITDEILTALGVSQEQLAGATEVLNEELRKRVGIAVLEELDEKQLAEMKTVNKAELVEWIRERVKNVAEIVEEETAILMGEIVERRGK